MNELDLAKLKELYKAPFHEGGECGIFDANGVLILMATNLELRSIFCKWINEEWEKKNEL